MYMRFGALSLAAWLAFSPTTVLAAWQTVFTEQGKSIEIDKDSIKLGDENGIVTARGRIVLEKPIVDPKTSAAYRIIEVEDYFNCAERTLATHKRSYFKEENELLRTEEVRSPFDLPVRSGSPDEKLFREACRPRVTGTSTAAKAVEKANAAAAEMRKTNEEIIARAVAQDLKKLTSAKKPDPIVVQAPTAEPVAAEPVKATPKPGARRSAAHPVASEHAKPTHGAVHWSYEGAGAPENWARLDPEYAVCGNGKRQSPIDIRDGIQVDLEPIQFDYKPANFRVSDNGHSIQVTLMGGSISVLGQRYVLKQFHFHKPSEEMINGKRYDMVAHLVHQSDQGKLAVVTVLFERGNENPIMQMVWNNLPLEKGDDVTPPGQTIDLLRLLPENRNYFTYMGSLTTPPCTEGVLWLVLKQPVPASAEQIAIFSRLYNNNARPIQNSNGRLIKESR